MLSSLVTPYVSTLTFMETMGDRIRSARGKAALTQQQLADAAGVSRAAVAQWENGETKNLRPENLFKIATRLGCDAQWLATGVGENASEPSNIEPGPRLYPPVPVISWVQAGNWTEVSDPYPPGVGEDWVQPATKMGPHGFALRIRGDSMEPEFTEGDTILVDPDREAVFGSFVVVRIEAASEATFKQLVIDGGSTFLKPLNPRYQVIPINGNATIVGTVVAKMKSY